jgi:hypothetical protein
VKAQNMAGTGAQSVFESLLGSWRRGKVSEAVKEMSGKTLRMEEKTKNKLRKWLVLSIFYCRKAPQKILRNLKKGIDTEKILLYNAKVLVGANDSRRVRRLSRPESR